jgi:hypothetical protein
MAEIELTLTTDILRDGTGLIRGLRVRSDSKWASLDLWLWLDRNTDHAAELKLYRVTAGQMVN